MNLAAVGVRLLSTIITTPPLPLLVFMALRNCLAKLGLSRCAPPVLKDTKDQPARCDARLALLAGRLAPQGRLPPVRTL